MRPRRTPTIVQLGNPLPVFPVQKPLNTTPERIKTYVCSVATGRYQQGFLTPCWAGLAFMLVLSFFVK